MFAKIAVKVGKTSDPKGNRIPVSGVIGGLYYPMTGVVLTQTL